MFEKRKLSVNPYYRAIELLYKRLAWDIRAESWRSRKVLKNWRDRFKDKKAIIICNGPSLLKSDLSLTKGIFTFGLNKINLLFDKSNFRPSCIVAINPHVIEQNAAFYNETDIPLFIDYCRANPIKPRPNVAFLNSCGVYKFARDCSISINKGHTVTFAALQLAFHMGFSKVALIGCDHNFITKGPANKLITTMDRDENHFDENYFSAGTQWQLPDYHEMEINYILSKKAYNESGRKIYNSTVGGMLEVFERCTLEEFIEKM